MNYNYSKEDLNTLVWYWEPDHDGFLKCTSALILELKKSDEYPFEQSVDLLVIDEIIKDVPVQNIMRMKEWPDENS